MCRRAGRFHGKLICGHAGHARARRGLKCAPARRTRQLWPIAEGAGGKSCWHGQHELMQQYERTVGVRTTGPLNARAAGPCSGQIVGSVAEQRRSRGAKARRRDRGGMSPRRRGQQGEKFLFPPSSLPVHSITSSICVGTHRIPNNSIFTLVQRWNSPDLEPYGQSRSRVRLVPNSSNCMI